MPRDRNIPQIDPGDQPLLENLARMIGELLERRLGPNATFEDRQRARMEVMADVMWLGEEHDLVDLVEDAPMITIGGRPFRRLSQPSSKIDSGVWGAHCIEEPLYRDASVHAGEVVERALTYLKPRRKLMRYAHLRALKLPIGSGATESSCALMQTRVKRPGMAWEPPGLRGVLCLRGLVLAKRWEAVWPSFSANSRVSVEAA